MTVSQPSVTRLLATLAAVSSRLSGGGAICDHVARLAAILGEGVDVERRGAAAGELDQLIGAVVQLATGSRGHPLGHPIDLGELASGLFAFATYLRAPTREREAALDEVTATLADTVPPTPLGPRQIDGRLEELALDAARGRGLAGAALRDAVTRMTGEMRAVIGRLERQATHGCTGAEVERELRLGLDQILRGPGPATA